MYKNILRIKTISRFFLYFFLKPRRWGCAITEDQHLDAGAGLGVRRKGWGCFFSPPVELSFEKPHARQSEQVPFALS
jgi:hypothetical protein